jgi:hypothetical protein
MDMIAFWVFVFITFLFGLIAVIGVIQEKDFALFGLVGILVFGLITVTIYQSQRFDYDFNRGEIIIEANIIEFGGKNSPKQTVLPDYIPTGYDEIKNIPRSFELNEGCSSLELDEEATIIFASTNSVTYIEILGPPGPGGSVNICIEKGTADVVLWSK